MRCATRRPADIVENTNQSMASVAILSFYSGIVDRGVETFAYEISKRLSKKHKIIIFQAGSKIQNTDVRTYQIKSFAKIPHATKNILSKIYLDTQSLKILFFTLKTFSKLTTGKYDVIIPLNGGWQIVLIKILSIITKSKILVSGHAGIGADDAWNIFFHPDVFVALTSSEEKWARRLTQDVKIKKIANGVDLSKFHPNVQPKKIKLPKPIVICVSALVPYKRIELTIKAVAKSKNLSLLLVGEGQEHGYLDTLGKRLLGSKYIRLVIPYQEMPGYYRAADVFTLASGAEAFGISYVEAMACNLPVVTTNDQSREEIIGDAGILTNPLDIDTYAKDLQIAAKTYYRNIPYNQALKFSWNKIALLYSKTIDELTTTQKIND